MRNLKHISLYVTEAEHARLTAEAQAVGVSLSYYVRALLDQYAPVTLPPLKKQGAPPGNRNAQKKPRPATNRSL